MDDLDRRFGMEAFKAIDGTGYGDLLDKATERKWRFL